MLPASGGAEKVTGGEAAGLVAAIQVRFFI
jgi:hypothetical protein